MLLTTGIGLLVSRPQIRSLLENGVAVPPLSALRAQTGDALTTGDVDVSFDLLVAGEVQSPLTHQRAQAGGALATGDV